MTSFHKIATALIALLSSCSVVNGGPDETVVYTLCNSTAINNFGFDNLVHDVLEDIVENTSVPGYSYYSSNDQIIYSKCFGHGACNGKLTREDSDTSMRRARDLILHSCFHHIGAQLQLQDCRTRFEQYYFYEG